MSLLPPGYVAHTTAHAELLLTDTCDIREYTAISDMEGGQTDTWTTTETDVPCHFAPAGAGIERIIGERLSAEVQWVGRLPLSVTRLDPRDRIVWNGRSLEVVFVLDRTNRIVQVVAAKEAP